MSESERPPRRVRLRGRVEAMGTAALARLESIRQRSAVVALVWECAERFRRLNGSVLVGHLAYRLFLWLAPMMLVFIGLFGISRAQNIDILRYATDVGVSEEFATDLADQAEQSGVTSFVIGLGALLIATASLVRGLHYVFAQAWGMEITSRKHILRATVITIGGATMGVVLLLVVSAIQRHGAVLALSGWAVTLVGAVAALWLVCMSMPRRTANWLDILPGPIVGALAISGVNLFAAIYVPARVEEASQLYGSIGVALGVLFYLFLVAFALVGMTFVNAVWTDRDDIVPDNWWMRALRTD